jgi:hypothetical protein
LFAQLESIKVSPWLSAFERQGFQVEGISWHPSSNDSLWKNSSKIGGQWVRKPVEG